jgi:hypothetical protein
VSTLAAVDEARVAAVVANDDAGCGGGFVSMLVVTEIGSTSSARRKSVLMKSRCFWEAVKFVRMSECSSDCWMIVCVKMSLSNHNPLSGGMAYGFRSVEELIVQVES